MSKWRTWLLLGASGVLAASAGYFASGVLGSAFQAPTQTVTIDVGQGSTGATGPAGPAGPPGPKGDPGTPGAESCPTGSTFKAVTFNTPGGHTTIWTCVAG